MSCELLSGGCSAEFLWGVVSTGNGLLSRQCVEVAVVGGHLGKRLTEIVRRFLVVYF